MEQIKFSDPFLNKEKKGLKEKIKKDLLKKKHILEKIKQLDVNEAEIDFYLGYFVSYDEDFEMCRNCSKLEDCPKEIKGMKLDLIRDEQGDITRVYDLCDYKKEELKILKNYVIRDFPDKYLNIELEDLDGRTGRIDLEYELLNYDLEKKEKQGMYVFGKPNTGKSFPFIAFLNGLVRKDISCAFVDIRQFLDLIKKSFGERGDETSNLLDRIKNVEVLVFDDLGEEKISEWSRDDIIAPILDYRIKNNLVTFITSNYNFKQLEALYSISKNTSDIAKIKAENFIEKVKNSCPIVIEVK